MPLNIGASADGDPSGVNKLIQIAVVQSSVLPRFMTNGFIKAHKKRPCGVLLSRRRVIKRVHNVVGFFSFSNSL